MKASSKRNKKLTKQVTLLHVKKTHGQSRVSAGHLSFLQLLFRDQKASSPSVKSPLKHKGKEEA